MNKVKVLIEGYAKKLENGWLASSTTTLIESNGRKIIVDPGCNRPKLLEELSKNNLRPTNIDYVLSTHYHTDHSLLAGIFDNALVLDNGEIYDDDKQVKHNNKIPKTDIEIIQTPGHSNDSCSLIVKCDDGVYVVAGDVFWWMDDKEQKTDYNSLINHQDPYVKDEKAIQESRKKVLEIADYIIPGHGKMFKVEEK